VQDIADLVLKVEEVGGGSPATTLVVKKYRE